jgi:hypothetical protein
LLIAITGTPVCVFDKHGNSPLHYAAKYGHLELCKYLVEQGAAAHIKNKAKQSPYDVAESHLVRQYLLPLLLQAERNHGIAPQDYSQYGGIAGMHQQQTGPVTVVAPMPMPTLMPTTGYVPAAYYPPAPAPIASGDTIIGKFYPAAPTAAGKTIAPGTTPRNKRTNRN